MVEEEEKNLFSGIEKRGRKERKKERKKQRKKERKKERKDEKKKERKKEKGYEEVSYTQRGGVLILPGIPLSKGHSMAMELSPNIRAG